MAKTYTALRDVGRFKAGDIIADMADATINQLLANGSIKEVEPAKPVKTETKAESKAAKVEGVENVS